MTEKIKISISKAVAAYVRPGSSIETRMSGCAAAASMPAADHIMLLFCLTRDMEQSVRECAVTALKSLPAEVINEYIESGCGHPQLLETLSALCANHPLNQLQTETPEQPVLDAEEELQPDVSADIANLPNSEVDDDAPVNEEDELFLSKYKIAQIMSIGEKIKMALSGDKEWRKILVKDSNKLVSSGVIKNPRTSEAEILTLVKSGIQNDEIMRLICANKEWVKNYQIRKALIENSRTPMQNAMRYLATMGEKDLAQFAKSKNISSTIATLAKRLLLNKKK